MAERAPDSVRIFDYLDYREFMKDAYQVKKRKAPNFSYRYIARKIATNSGTLSRIFSGQRHLDPKMANGLARAFNLHDGELEYFETLVLFGQAKTHIEKNLFLEKLFRLRSSRVITLEERQFEFYRKWYYPAIRELLNVVPFDGNYAKLSKMLRPAIGVQEAKKAVKLIYELGLVEKDKDGIYRLTEKLISSGDNVQAVFMTNLHAAMADLAAKAINEVAPEERDFSGLTISLSSVAFYQILEILKQTRRTIMEQSSKDSKVDKVYRLNLQFFPLSYESVPELT